MNPIRIRRILVTALAISLVLCFSLATADTTATATEQSWSSLGFLEEYFQKAKEFFQKKENGEADSKAREPAPRFKRTEPSGGEDQGENLTTALTRVAETTIPAVVHIEVTQRREVPNPFLQFEDNPELREYFGLPKDMPKKFEQELTGLGTGMIVDPQVTVLRNNKEQDLAVRTGSLDQLSQRMALLVKEWLGVEVGPVTEKEAEQYGMENPAGVVIQSLDPNGPLAKAQFEEHDLILAINNQPVESVDSFLNMVGSLPPGEKAVMAGVDHRTGKAGMVEVEIPKKD